MIIENITKEEVIELQKLCDENNYKLSQENDGFVISITMFDDIHFDTYTKEIDLYELSINEPIFAVIYQVARILKWYQFS